MDEEKLTKEETKAIKHGRAYKNWRRRIFISIGVFLLWGIAGIPLAHLNSITRVVYLGILLLVIIIEFYTIVLTSWKCFNCKGKLPLKSVQGGSISVCMPVLVKKCPCCGADLTR